MLFAVSSKKRYIYNVLSFGKTVISSGLSFNFTIVIFTLVKLFAGVSLILSIPLYFLYELGTILVFIFEKKKKVNN